MGRPRLPDAVKQARGTYRPGREAARRQAEATPMPVADPADVPSPPDDLDEPGKAAWAALAPMIVAHGPMSPATGHMLLEYCRTASLLHQAENEIRTRGFSIVGKSGAVKGNPAVKAAERLRTQLENMRATIIKAAPAAPAGSPAPAGPMLLEGEHVILAATADLPALVEKMDGGPSLHCFLNAHPVRVAPHLRALADKRWQAAFGEREREREAESRRFQEKIQRELARELRRGSAH